MNKVKYIYPQLSLKPSQDFSFFRLGGPGLANCLFVVARAYLRAKDLKCKMLRPTWERISIGQLYRGERDKRLYYGLFKNESIFNKLKKAWLVRFSNNVETIFGLGNFFEDILDRSNEIREWFFSAIEPTAIETVPIDLHSNIAVHVRLGDFPIQYRVSIKWYKAIISEVQKEIGHSLDILLFSDGQDKELVELLEIPGVKRVCYGNALADMVAISRCGMLIAGKYSTFSAWGAYLGNVPSVFSSIDYGRVLPDSRFDIRLGENTQLPLEFIRYVKKKIS